MILDVERNSPEEHEAVKFKMRQANQAGDFTRRDRSLPIKYLEITSSEELLVQQAKKRPAVILSSSVDQYEDIRQLLKQKGKRHQQEDAIFVVPCYGIQTEFDPYGFIPEIVFRIRHMLYRQFFYVPASKKFDEGVLRLDRIQVVVGRDRSAIEPSDVCLSQEVTDFLLALFSYCLTGAESDDLTAILDLTRKKYPK